MVAAAESSHPNKGFVTHHMGPELLNDGAVDIYLCGPPPMVDAVRKHLTGKLAALAHPAAMSPNPSGSECAAATPKTFRLLGRSSFASAPSALAEHA